MDFAVNITKLMPGVKVIHVFESEVEEMIEERKPWMDVREVPGVSSAHVMVCEKDDEVKLYKDSMKDELVNRVYYGRVEDDSEGVEDDSEGVEDDDDKREENVVDAEIGDWVVVIYEGKLYPGKVTVKKEHHWSVKVMKPCFPSGWTWPSREDEIPYPLEDIRKKVEPPHPLNSRCTRWEFDVDIYEC